MLGIHVGDGAGACDIQIAADENGTYRRTRLDRLGLLLVGSCAANPHNRHQPGYFELWRKPLDGLFAETIEDKRRLDRGEVLRVAGYVILFSADRCLADQLIGTS